MSIKIATWNVNSIKARTNHVVRWLGDNPVDILCIQELKCQTEDFPYDTFKAIGYHAIVHGQKAYNGVAILSRESINDFEIPDLHEESRIISTIYKNINIMNIYAVNGNPVGTEKYDKKLMWTKGLIELLKKNIAIGQDTILLGDFNIIPTALDAAHPENWTNDALYLPETKSLFREMIYLGYTDIWRTLHPNEANYTFWDYQQGAWERNNGIRIDHILSSPRMMDRVVDCVIDPSPRGWEKPSDHVPVIVTITD